MYNSSENNPSVKNSGQDSNQGVFWLIGASSGIGKALALLLAEQGWKVAISARSKETLENMQSSHANLFAYPLDVTHAGEIKKVYQKIKDDLAEIDTCLYNVGDYTPMPLEDYDANLFENLIKVNYLGAVHLLDTIVPDFTARGYGNILLTASIAAYRGLPRSAPYSASKAALLNLAESLHLELQEKGISMRVINPGFVKTPLTDKNAFKMPAMISADDAALSIIRQLQTSSFEIRFPALFAFTMNVLRILPYRLYFLLTRRTL